jgi:hypothetical protein
MLRKKIKIRLRKRVKTAGTTILEAKERLIRVRLGKEAKGYVILRKKIKIRLRKMLRRPEQPSSKLKKE